MQYIWKKKNGSIGRGNNKYYKPTILLVIDYLNFTDCAIFEFRKL